MNKFLSSNRAVTPGIIVIGIALLVMLLPNISIADAPPGTSQGGAADAARWARMAQYYQARAADEAVQRALANEATALRWERMAHYYQAQAIDEAAQRVRANETAALRWEAMGDLYTRKAMAIAQQVNDALAARWKAAAEFYAAQHR